MGQDLFLSLSPSLLFFCFFPCKGVSTGDQVQLGCNLSCRPLVTRQIAPFICSWAAARRCIFHPRPRMDLLARRNVTSLNALICHKSTIFTRITAPQTVWENNGGEIETSSQTMTIYPRTTDHTKNINNNLLLATTHFSNLKWENCFQSVTMIVKHIVENDFGATIACWCYWAPVKDSEVMENLSRMVLCATASILITVYRYNHFQIHSSSVWPPVLIWFYSCLSIKALHECKTQGEKVCGSNLCMCVCEFIQAVIQLCFMRYRSLFLCECTVQHKGKNKQ